MKVALIMMDPMLSKRRHRAGGAGYSLVAYLKHKNIYRQDLDIKVFNFNSLYKGAININASAVVDFKPEVIGFSVYCWNTELIYCIIKLIKPMLPNSLIVLGGPEVSYNSVNVLEHIPEVDIVVRGEGEITFNEVIECYISGNKKYSNTLGITYRNDTGKIFVNTERPLHPVLDDFPSPFQTGIIDLSESDGEAIYETVRGCSFSCSYCLYTKGMNIVREYSMERIEQDLRMILTSPHINIIWFIDPTFNASSDRAINVLKIVEKYNPNMELALELRADLLTDDLIAQLARLNIAEVGIGLQSYSEDTNKFVNRKNNITIVKEKLDKLRDAISKTCTQFDIDLIYGLPGDTYENYKNSVDYVISLGGRIHYQPLRVFKGTNLHQDVLKYGIEYNASPPYNVIKNRTYSFENMIRSYCLNVGIDCYNKSEDLKKIIDSVVHDKGVKHVDFFECFGRYFWDKQMYSVFRIANWTTDDRHNDVVFRDINEFLKYYLNSDQYPRYHNLIKKQFANDINAITDNSAFFNLAI